MYFSLSLELLTEAIFESVIRSETAETLCSSLISVFCVIL